MVQEFCNQHEYVETTFTATGVPATVKAIVCRKCGKLLDTGQLKEIISEWQLCPKCNGDGHLGRYNSPMFSSTNMLPQCDVCFGAKMIVKPLGTGTK